MVFCVFSNELHLVFISLWNLSHCIQSCRGNSRKDNSIPTISGSIFNFEEYLSVPRGYEENDSLDGNAESVDAFDSALEDLALNPCTTCFYEYDADNDSSTPEGTTIGYDAAILWNIGSDDETPCPTQA